MEKRKPTHDLAAFKRAFAQNRFMTRTATESAFALGYSRRHVSVFVAENLTRADFIKSMTSYGDHRQWQDVYTISSDHGPIYIKFTDHVVTEFILLSFKVK